MLPIPTVLANAVDVAWKGVILPFLRSFVLGASVRAVPHLSRRRSPQETPKSGPEDLPDPPDLECPGPNGQEEGDTPDEHQRPGTPEERIDAGGNVQDGIDHGLFRPERLGSGDQRKAPAICWASNTVSRRALVVTSGMMATARRAAFSPTWETEMMRFPFLRMVR